MAKRILFQGDSITDCGRNRNEFYGMAMPIWSRHLWVPTSPVSMSLSTVVSAVTALWIFTPESRSILSI